MTSIELRLPAPSVPARAARVVRDHVHVRLALLVVLWLALAVAFLDWRLIVLQSAFAALVLGHALRRERLLQAVDGKRVQLELVTAVAAFTDEATSVEELLARATREICRQAGWPHGRVWLSADEAPALVADAFATAAQAREESHDGVRLAVPVVADHAVAAVLELGSPESRATDHTLLEALPLIGRQLGQAVTRTHAQQSSRESEQQLRSLIETLPLATYMDRPGEETGTSWVSPQMTGITSYEQHEWAENPMLFRSILHSDDRARVLDEMQRVRRAKEPLDIEYRIRRRDGSFVWVHDSAVNVDVDGVTYTRGFIVDVNARRLAESERDDILEQLRLQNEQLRQVDSLKDEFVALVSHELRTPLTSIRGYLELMSEDANLTGDQRRYLTTIDRNASRLQRVVGDLLFCAQVEAGKLTFELGELDLDALVGEALEVSRPAASDKQIELAASLGGLDRVRGDRARLAQVLDNLVSNAVKFTPTGGRVTITTTRRDEQVELTVSDTGMGIPPAEVAQLFQRFYRTAGATAATIPGTGLGLSIAKAIVEGHGGTIAVESAEGAGTIFRVTLPLAA